MVREAVAGGRAALPDGTSLAVAATRNLVDAGRDVLAVVREPEAAIGRMLAGAGVRPIGDIDASLGMAHSLTCGAGASATADAWQVARADMPGSGRQAARRWPRRWRPMPSWRCPSAQASACIRWPMPPAGPPLSGGDRRGHRRVGAHPCAALVRPQRADRAGRCPRDARMGDQRLLAECRGARCGDDPAEPEPYRAQRLAARCPVCRGFRRITTEHAMSLLGRQRPVAGRR